ncbi:serine hydrolase [Novosphingobium sp.]|uniref:serine hydrolase domain-containing protein n=1 Tax=Novosphingobium sp. TaxID=1874826 RepID=UPI0025DDEA66|nr:serine hydrolase domain-containing protein [Novosphingobium sp.]
MLRHAFALVALTLPLPVVAQALTPAEQTAIDQAVTRTLKETGVPSAQVAVVRGGQIVLDKAWGKASERIPVATEKLPYQIASNSKQFLAALLLLLEDDGKLRLDDPVSKWLPAVSGADRMTVRQLLSHTSGLQDFWPQDYLFSDMTRPTLPQGIIDRWASKPLDYQPGTRMQYSNTGYVVAGLIAEKAGGKPLWQQFDARLFKPLGIKPYKLDETNGAAFPQGYHRAALGPVRVATPPARGWLWAAGELSMTAAELARWDVARMNRSLLPREDWEEMETPVRLADGTASGYGLGVSKHQVKGRTVIDHGGESVGFLSQSSTWIDDKVAVVVLTNADFAGVPDTLTDQIADVVLPKAVQADIGEAARDEDIRATLAELTASKLDPARFTANARFYFTPQTLADYAQSLSPLGVPQEVKALGKPRLRGGFVNRNFALNYKDGQKLVLITYAEPGEKGRWEQFIVMPR